MKHVLWGLGVASFLILVFIVVKYPRMVYNPRPKEDASQPITQPTSQEALQTTTIEDVQWKIVEFENFEFEDPDSIEIEVYFEKDRVAGLSGCNYFNSNYQIDDSKLTIGEDIALTRKACPEALMKLERAFLDALVQVDNYAFLDEKLALRDENGEVLMIFSKAKIN